MVMNALTPISGQGESHNKLPSPSTSPRLIQHPPDIIKSEPITDIHLAKWKAEDDLLVKANRQTPDSHSSSAATPFFCQPPAAIDTRKCEPMSPPDNYSVTSSPQTFGWPPSSDSGESEPWTLHHHELLPDHSAYANSPSSPASGWDCAVPYQFQHAPTSAAYFPDCSVSFPTSTPPPMQANSYSPVFEMASSYGSPHYPPSHFGDGSPTQHRPMTAGISDMSSLGNEPTSHHDYSGVMPTPPSDYPCTSDVSKAKSDINSLPYSQLLYRAFMSSNTRKLSLRQIYQWFEDNTNKAVNNKGWQNSIRHNLSMNRAFEKAPLKEDGSESRRATEWVLADWALQEGVQSTTRYRKGNIRSKSHGSERERMAHSSYSGGRRGVVGYNARGRERLYSHHRMPMHGMAPDSHVLYGAPVPAPAHPSHLATSHGSSDVEGYVPQAGGLCYSPMEAQEGYNGFSQDDGSSYSSYSMYNLGEANMGEYAIVGGVPDNTLAVAHAGGVAPPPTVVVAFEPPLAMSNGQQQRSYAHAGYDTRQGISEGVHE
ncbi:forkhead domain-containing protein [Cordyceps fumosorosea ARSEF 2679]|uniref:Forkhead domain-containing protein n=1 Tax=Cordyceps fumosorosea (strain ARSEF 2679) TaxID=1081104 RepID=A0A167V2N8_CORFA|nr:forkhead domain-containing protein [Cordyceps fumosorosea ARSEF 2679]OAA62166.1 forkhead domain-containing protein [Cordyceps fumosorosea ARSEF 2679]